jgi:hypothetical protein
LKVFVLHTAVLAEFPLGLPYSEAVKNAVSASEDACVEMEGLPSCGPAADGIAFTPLMYSVTVRSSTWQFGSKDVGPR